jgi:hypothetical protein
LPPRRSPRRRRRWGNEDASHLLNRAGFGARPADLARVLPTLTREAAVERLLAETSPLARTPGSAELADLHNRRCPPSGN